jgi:hypothetical protein
MTNLSLMQNFVNLFCTAATATLKKLNKTMNTLHDLYRVCQKGRTGVLVA